MNRIPAFEINKMRDAIKKAHGNSATVNKKVNLMSPEEVTKTYSNLKVLKKI